MTTPSKKKSTMRKKKTATQKAMEIPARVPIKKSKQGTERPTKYRTLSEDLWKEVRRLYEAGVSPTKIMNTFSIPMSTFYSRRKTEKWKTPLRAGKHGPVIAAQHLPQINQTTDKNDTCQDCLNVMTSQNSGGQGLPATAPAVAPDKPGALLEAEALELARQKTEATKGQLTIAQKLRRRIEDVLDMEELPVGKTGSLARFLAELAQALERLQKVERTALDMDRGAPATMTPVVIIVPQKASEEAWQEKARKLQEGRDYSVS